VTKAANTKKLV